MSLKVCVILLTLPVFLPVYPTGKSPSFYRGQPSSSLLGTAMCKNLQKSHYGPCKINGSESRRPFQKFYYEKKLVGRRRSRRRAKRSLIEYYVRFSKFWFLKKKSTNNSDSDGNCQRIVSGDKRKLEMVLVSSLSRQIEK